MERKGIITAMVTPMDEDQQIDFVATRNLVKRLISKGVDGLFILGTNGEAHALTNEERLAFAKTVVDEVGGCVPVYAGVGENSTSATDPTQFTSHWPAGGSARPRSATVVITRNDGGKVGV